MSALPADENAAADPGPRPYRSAAGRKVRKTLTLDPEVVEAFGSDTNALSAAVNEVLQAEIGRRQRRAALGRFLDELDETFGKPDPAEVERFRRALA